jgi:hypothetical protein
MTWEIYGEEVLDLYTNLKPEGRRMSSSDLYLFNFFSQLRVPETRLFHPQ